MIITRTSAGDGLPAGFPFSLAAAAHGLCFMSGMVALGSDGKFASGSFEEEADLAWHDVAAVAEARPAPSRAHGCHRVTVLVG